MKWQRKFSTLGFTLTLVVVFALSACNPDQQIALGGTRAWIDIPRDRSVISLKPHEVIAHASDAGGVRLVELVVNGASIGAMNCENLAQPLVTCRAMWNPLAPGEYRLEARATNASSGVGISAPVLVTVGVLPPPPQIFTLTPTRATRAPTLSPTPTLTPTRLSEPPQIITVTPTPTRIVSSPLPPAPNTNTPTITSSPAPVCPGAPLIAFFSASPTTITQGQSSTLNWGSVSNATSVEIDHGIGGVPTPGSRGVNPQTTTTYTLTAIGCGGTVTRQVIITVNPASTPTRTRTPTTPPPHPPAAPSNLRQVSRACATPDRITVAWNDNSNNETGFRIYRRAHNPDTIWALVGAVGANTTQYADNHSFSKFKTIEYQVEAFNNAGASSRAMLSVGECVD